MGAGRNTIGGILQKDSGWSECDNIDFDWSEIRVKKLEIKQR
jgi:hypothetical protein